MTKSKRQLRTEAVDRGIWAAILKSGLAYADRESLEACVNVAMLKQAVHRKMMSPRACRECGAEFEPTFANQSRCRPCIERRRRCSISGSECRFFAPRRSGDTLRGETWQG